MTTIISDAGVQFAGGNIVDVRSTVPTSGTYTAGDFILEASTAVKVTGWKRLTTGSGHVLNTDWVYVGGLTLGTAVATTSGTSIDFTGIPSWVKRITVMLNGLSTNGTSNEILQIGSGSVQVSGYLGSAATNTTYAAFTAGFGLGVSITSAAVLHGIATLVSLGGNVWSFSFNGTYSNSPATAQATGSVTLSGALDRLRLTTANGTDTFDAGSINILYE